MIRGVHTMLYSSNAEATRAFIRDVLGLSHTDVGEGWLIFDLPEGDVGIHPEAAHGAPGTHMISFYCDDIDVTVRDLEAKGAAFSDAVHDEGFGLVTHFQLPGVGAIQLYQPHYAKA